MKKKILNLTLATVLILGLFGCSASESPPDTSLSDTEAAGPVGTTAPPEIEGLTEDTQPPATTLPDTTEATEEQDQQVETPRQSPQWETEPTEQTPATEPTQPPTTEPTTPPHTEPPATEPPTAVPPATTPPETQPPESEPPATEPSAAAAPSETVPPAEVIDLAVLESYGREYASGYGYWGNPSTGFATNAGYYPPSRVTIKTMADGYRRVRELVDAQYANDVAAGRPITAIVDGIEVHRKINIYIQSTDDPDIYLLYCFYGGD